MKFSKQPEILRLHEIDSTYQSQLFMKFSQSTQALAYLKLLPQQFLRKYQQELRLINNAIFNYLNLIHCRKSLGQEYTYVNYFNQQDYDYQGTTLNKKHRLIMFLFITFGSYLVKKLVERTYTKLLQQCKSKANKSNNLLTIIFSRFPEYSDLVDKYDKILLTIFMLKGDFYNLIQRILKIQFIYLKIVKQVTIQYKREGLLMLIQLIIETLYEIYVIMNLFDTQSKQNALAIDQKIQTALQINQQQGSKDCDICAQKIKARSVTPCGHSFCWECIIRATEIKAQCPYCKTKCSPNRIIQLKNY